MLCWPGVSDSQVARGIELTSRLVVRIPRRHTGQWQGTGGAVGLVSLGVKPRMSNKYVSDLQWTGRIFISADSTCSKRFLSRHSVWYRVQFREGRVPALSG